MSLFPNGIKLKEGGVDSALEDADQAAEPKLYQVSGKRKFKVCSVPVAAASINSRDTYVLDLGAEDVVIQWVPNDASPMLKYRTLDLAEEVKQEYHAGSAKVCPLSRCCGQNRALTHNAPNHLARISVPFSSQDLQFCHCSLSQRLRPEHTEALSNSIACPPGRRDCTWRDQRTLCSQVLQGARDL